MIYLKITQIRPNEREIIHRQNQRQKIERVTLVLWLVFLGFCWGFTPYYFNHLEEVRGYAAIGSEIIIPFVPFILIPLFDAISDLIIKKKGLNEND